VRPGAAPTDRRIAFLLIAILLQQEKHDQAMHETEQAMMQFGIDDQILSARWRSEPRWGR